MKHWRKNLLFRAGFYLALSLFLSPVMTQAGEAAAPAAESSAAQTEAPPRDKVLRLDDAVRIALENHPNLRVARERVGAQQAVLGQEFAAYYPTVRLSNFYRTSTSSGTTTTTQEAFDFFSSQASFDMTLYNFGKREGAVQSARDSVEATQYNLRASVNDVVLAVKQAYYGYLQAQALVRVRGETVKNRELLVRQARGFFEVGTRAKIDVARAEANLYGAQADLIAAQNAVKIAWTTLKNAMGMPDLPEQPVAEDLAIPPVSLPIDRARQIAFDSRPELRGFEAQRKAQDEKIAAARRGHLPDILFSADYGRRNTSRGGNTFPLQLTWQVQLSLNIPIFDGFRTTHKVEEALRNYHSVRAQEEEKKQQVALEVEQSYVNLVNAQERIKATDSAEQAAKENFDLATGRYQVGVGSIIEVTDAQTLYTDAQTNHIRSLYDYKIAEAQLIRAMGRQ
ncbi:MAG: TolC family protein [Deltaproteobacteria bacterium]|nr:TolC family protein [Deltaproteobacteria bacterium]